MIRRAWPGLIATAFCARAHAQSVEHYLPASIPAYAAWSAASADLIPALDPAGQPQGIPLAGTRIYPDLTVRLGEDTDPLGGAQGKSSAIETNLFDTRIVSESARATLVGNVQVNNTNFLSLPDDSYTDWNAALSATIRATEQVIDAGYAHIAETLLPGDTATVRLRGEVAGEIDDLRLSDAIGDGPFTADPYFRFQSYRFSAGPGDAGQPLFNRDVVEGALNLAYDFAGGHNILLVLGGGHTDLTAISGNLPGNGYDEISATTGIEYRQSALLVYRILAGYSARFLDHAASGHGTITEPQAELDAIWSPSRIAAVTLALTHGLADEPDIPAQGLAETRLDLKLDYALYRNVLVTADAGLLAVTGTGAGTNQTNVTAGLKVTWAISRYVSAEAAYDFGDIGGAGRQAGFTRHVITASVSLHL